MPLTYNPETRTFDGEPTLHYVARHISFAPRPRCTCPPTAIRPDSRHVALCAITIERRQRLHLTQE